MTPRWVNGRFTQAHFMGGNAFLATIEGASFPRMAPDMYHALKARHLAQLESMFQLVGVPREAPGKESHGDIDFVVCSPTAVVTSPVQYAEKLKTALGAKHYIADHQAVNLAIQLKGTSEFYQVDVNKYQDEEEWRRVMFFQSYGDLGMILGVVARNNGLSLGLHGLKVPHEDSMPPFLLSADFERILTFFGLDLAAWEAGFASVQDVFEWVALSRLFDARAFKESMRREHRRGDRKMYQEFLQWVLEQKAKKLRPEARLVDVVEEAKDFFGQKAAYEEEAERGRNRRRVKEALNGKLVMEWTGRSGPIVRKVIDLVREGLDEDSICRLTRAEMRDRVLEANKRTT